MSSRLQENIQRILVFLFLDVSPRCEVILVRLQVYGIWIWILIESMTGSTNPFESG